MNEKGENFIKEIEKKILAETVFFFDLDGTLVDTDYANFLAYNKAVNLILNKNITYNSTERFTREKLLLTFPNLTKTEIERIIEKKEIFFENYLRETKLNMAIYNMLIKYHKTNRTFLLTNSRKNRALIILQYYNIEKKFERIFYRQFDKNKKINKFKGAISKLALKPQTIIVFENEQTEIMNAINAGIPVDNIIKIKRGE